MRTPQGYPGNAAIPRCSALSWPIWRLPGSARVVPAPGQTHYSATRPTHREGSGRCCAPEGPGRDPAALGPDRAPQTPRFRRRTTPALRLTGLAKGRNVIKRSFNDHKQW